MKILAVRPGPGFSVADVYWGNVRALAAEGAQVWDFNLDERLTVYSEAGRLAGDQFVKMFDEYQAVQLAARGLLAACYQWQPDAVLIVSGFYVPTEALDIIRSRGAKVVLLHTESPYEDDKQLIRGEHADLNVVNDPTNLERYKTLGPAFYLPHAYDPEIHRPGLSATKSDFAFVGTGFPSRIEFFEAIDWDGLDVLLGGNWNYLTETSPLRKYLMHDFDVCMDNIETADVYRGTKVSANLYRREAERPELVQGWAMGPREVELAACGTFFLRESRGESDELLPMLPTIETPGEFQELVRWYVAHDNVRGELAARARHAIEERTFSRNARQLLAAIETP